MAEERVGVLGQHPDEELVVRLAEGLAAVLVTGSAREQA